MSLYIDAGFESLNKVNEELCGDKVEIIRNSGSVTVVLADGLGSGVKANILATLTSKIIGTMLGKGANIDDAVETIASTLPVCKERGIAYSTFSIIQVFDRGEGYLVEFDNPSVIMLRKGKQHEIGMHTREISGKLVREGRFTVVPGDVFVMISDGVVHAGIGANLNLGWQWENVREYVERIYKQDMTAKNIVKLLLSVCDNLYLQKPGDDATVAVVKARRPMQISLIVGPPVNRGDDASVVRKFVGQPGRKIVCGGTTSQIVSHETGREIIAGFNYFNPAIPPIAEIDGIDLVTEGVLTLGKALDIIKNYLSAESSMQDYLNLNKKDGASQLSKLLLEEGTLVHFFVGRAMNPAHQNPELPLSLSIKLKLVEEIARCLESMGKKVILEYY